MPIASNPMILSHELGQFFVEADWLAKFEGHANWLDNWLLLVDGLQRQLDLSPKNAKRLASAIIERSKMPQR